MRIKREPEAKKKAEEAEESAGVVKKGRHQVDRRSGGRGSFMSFSQFKVQKF